MPTVVIIAHPCCFIVSEQKVCVDHLAFEPSSHRFTMERFGDGSAIQLKMSEDGEQMLEAQCSWVEIRRQDINPTIVQSIVQWLSIDGDGNLETRKFLSGKSCEAARGWPYLGTKP